MKRKGTRILAFLLVAMMVLTACGGGNNQKNSTPGDNSSAGNDSTPSDTTEPTAPSNGGEPIKDLVTWETSGNREMENFFMIGTEQAKDLNVLCNAISPLLEVDPYGKLNPAVATEWNTPDGGVTWDFVLRDDVTWVDVNGEYKADCTAQDWVTAMEWILNYHKNASQNTSMLCALVVGAQDYYDYTKGLDEATALALTTENNPEFDKVGIKSADATHLTYTCAQPCPYFATLCTSAALYPVSQAEIDEKGVENMLGMTNETMWYSGPYTITEYIMNNTKTLTKNESYWDKDASLFDTVTITMIEDVNMDDTLYETEEVHNTELSEANSKIIMDNPSDPRNEYLTETRLKKYSYQYQLNFDRRNADGTPDTNWNTAVANENFRKSLYYGINLKTTWARTNRVHPVDLENLCFSMKGLLYFSDGRDYTDAVIEKLDEIKAYDGENSRRFNEKLALEYRDKAIEELTAQGVTFPIEVNAWIKAGSDYAGPTVLKENWERTLGTDYIVYKINEYVTSPQSEVTDPHLQSYYGSGWGADYGDVENFLDQIVIGRDYAYYANKYTNINTLPEGSETRKLFEEFTAKVDEAKAITDDLDARYEKFAEAEAFLLNHALSIPSTYENAWQLTHINDYSKMNALYGCQNYTYKNWETSTEAYTADDYAQFKADFEANQ